MILLLMQHFIVDVLSCGINRHRSGVLIVNFGHISHLALVFLLLTLSKEMPAGKKAFSVRFRNDTFGNGFFRTNNKLKDNFDIWNTDFSAHKTR